MKVGRVPFRLRALALGLSVLILSMQPAAQPVPLPLPGESAVYVDMWAVTLRPGANPYEVAGRMGLVMAGAIPGTPDTYIFRGASELKRADAAMMQTFAAGMSRSPEVVNAVQQVLLERHTRDIDDPLYPDQWHLDNTGQGGGVPGEDANVLAAWALGYTGTGVVVSSVDDGLNHAHPDLTGNYLSSASWDFGGNDDDPSGGGHGTNVGGVMAADDDGTACGVGAAYTAQLSGLKLLNAPTDANEAAALTYEYQINDIYNNSWGPSDNGFVLEGPGPLTEAALADGVASGRGGLGSIYVWASGNGYDDDNVNADGYANSRFTIAVAATTDSGERAYYSEQGAPILINAPSGGGASWITTTSGTSSCTNGFGGTSAASPLAAGIIALMLEANPALTWRDVQHILVHSAEQNDPTDTGWVTNGAGHPYNHYYGFGRIDAGAAVTLAETWTNMPAETSFDSGVINVNAAIEDGPSGAFVTSTFNVPAAIQVEAVDVIINATHASRGQLYIELESPSGMVSVLMHGRPDSGDNYDNWRFNTVAHWDENSSGTWTLRVRDLDNPITGTLNSWQLKIYGTLSITTITEQPASMDVLFDEPATLSVAAVGGEPITYQWYEGLSGDTSSPIPLADQDTFTTPVLISGTYNYWVRATGSNNSADSDTAVLTVVNSVPMLDDPQFETPTAFSPWNFSAGEAKVKCEKKYVSPVCAARLTHTTNPAPAKVRQGVDLPAYPFSLRAGDTLTLEGQARAAGGINAKLKLKIVYSDATVDKETTTVTGGLGWQAFSLPFALTRADVTIVKAYIVNGTTITGLTVWADDVQIWHGRQTTSRARGDVLPPPPNAPDGMRGSN